MYADLHRHLDGSVRHPTLAALAATAGRQVPADLPFTPGMGLEAALARFAFTLSLLATPASVRRVHLVEIARVRPGVVGIDLAGGPAPGASHSLVDYAVAFRRAADHGIGRTVHAGEGRPPAEIRVAIETLLAQRIGHGTTLLDDPSVVDLVLARGVTIEACPTSNVHTGVIPSVAAHPLGRWLTLGVKVCVNTDNTLFSAVDAPEEHRRVRTIPGLGERDMAKLIAHGHAAAFRR